MKKIFKIAFLVPVCLILVVLIALTALFIHDSHSVEYGADEYEKSSKDYLELESVYVTEDYELVVADSELLPIAEKFNGYVEKIIGKKLNTVTAATSKPYISLAVNESQADNYIFEGDNTNIVISADNKDHLIRGAYAFLEEFGSLRCYTSKLIVPTSDKIFFPVKEGGYSAKYNDYFEMRDTDWISPKDDEYSWFRGFNTDEYRYEVKNMNSETEAQEEADERIKAQNEYYSSMGGRVQYVSSFCHTFTGDFLNSKKYYDEGLNLECYALDSKGERRRDELCLSEPKTAEIVTREVFDILENKNPDRHYDPEAPLQIISLTQADDLTGCKCEACVKCAKEHGGYSAPNILFVNKIAQAVKDAGYDNVAIDTFAYRYTRSAPTDIVPLDNVIVRLCTIECCNSHYIDDEKCAANKAFMKDLSDWSKICSRIYIWDYCTDFSYFNALFPNFNVLAHNIRVFYEQNVKGIYEEGNFTMDKEKNDPEFAELRAYLISRVMQDPYCDYYAVMKEFCDAYYGEAGEDMLKFITDACKYAGRRHLNIYKNPSLILKCSKQELAELNELFEHEKSVATGDALQNVKNSEICWRYIKMYKKIFEFGKSSSFEHQREQLILDIGAANNGRMHEVAENYKLASLAQTAMVDFYTGFDAIVGKFVYGP